MGHDQDETLPAIECPQLPPFLTFWPPYDARGGWWVCCLLYAICYSLGCESPGDRGRWNHRQRFEGNTRPLGEQGVVVDVSEIFIKKREIFNTSLYSSTMFHASRYYTYSLTASTGMEGCWEGVCSYSLTQALGGREWKIRTASLMHIWMSMSEVCVCVRAYTVYSDKWTNLAYQRTWGYTR